jgi:predicted RNase H-like HicB family nuclease
MKNEFTSIIERDGDWYIAYCPEVPGANGQGRTKDEARESLAAAITLILDDRREDALRGLPKDAEKGTVLVG